MKYIVDRDFNRLDFFLASINKNYSRNFYKKIILNNGVKVNKKNIKKPHSKLKKGDIIIFRLPSKEKKRKILKKSQRIIFEDKYILVIDKPPNLVSEDLISHGKLVHRLDKDTSGVLIIAKDETTLWKLQSQWKNKKVQKEYIALVKGKLEPKHGRIEAPIARSCRDRKKMVVCAAPYARDSTTEYKVLKYLSLKNGEEFSLVKIYPKTGRTHQIRVHFSAISHPVVGDKTYGDQKLNEKFEKIGLCRQFLHAEKIKVTHPHTKVLMKFESPVPADLRNILSFML